MKKLALLLCSLLSSQYLYASIVGFSGSNPINGEKYYLDLEIAKTLGQDSHSPKTARFSWIPDSEYDFDAGLRFLDSEDNDFAFFFGANFFLIGDNSSWRAFSLKPNIEWEKYEITDLYLAGIAPILQQNLDLAGRLVTLYFATPVSLRYNRVTKKYDHTASFDIGAKKNWFIGIFHFQFLIEMSFNLADGENILTGGLRFPFDAEFF